MKEDFFDACAKWLAIIGFGSVVVGIVGLAVVVWRYALGNC